MERNLEKKSIKQIDGYQKRPMTILKETYDYMEKRPVTISKRDP